MIGLSLSLCVQDIIRGIVNPCEVALIVSDTKAATPEQFERALDSYSESYWRVNPNYGKALARKLWEQGRLIQPRLLEGDRHEHSIAMGRWVLTNMPEPVLLGRNGELLIRCNVCGEAISTVSPCIYCQQDIEEK